MNYVNKNMGLDFQKLTKAELIETLKSLQSALGMDSDERDLLLRELRVHQIELEMQNQELRETQSKLEETSAMYADLYDFAPIGYVGFDDKGYIQEINLTGANVLGKERKFLINTPFAAYIEKSDLPRFRDHLWNCKRTSERVITEISLFSKEGGLIQVELSSIAVFDPKRSINLYRTAFSDITERKKVEEILQKTKDDLEIRVKERTEELLTANAALQREVMERKQAQINLAAEKERLCVTLFSIGDGVITTDREGKVILMNRVAENLTGWTKETISGKFINEVFHIVNEKTGESQEDFVARALATNEIINIETDVILVSGNGMKYLIHFNIAPILDLQNNNIGVVLVFCDITNQRRLEKEIIKIQKLESLGVLAGGIAHNFNNSLAGILANTQLSKMMLDKGKDITSNLQNIEKAIARATGLTKQLLAFAKGGAPVKKVVSVAELIKETVDFALQGSNARSELSIDDDLWLVKIDEGQINQVINNLIINATQAMPEGGIIKISAQNIILDECRRICAFHHALQPGRYVKIAVTDHGVGISEENMPYIFDPYFTTKEKGSGLGLTSSYAIVKRHNGYIEVESQPGVRTTFSMYLPACFKVDNGAIRSTELALTGTGKILLMDDEKDIRNITGEILNQIGYEVQLAEDGLAAVEFYTRAKESGAPFDVVIMDLTIPGGMGGKELLKKLSEINPEIKAIVSSGYSNDPVMSDYQVYGFCGVVTKPYRIEELHEKLDKIIHGVDGN